MPLSSPRLSPSDGFLTMYESTKIVEHPESNTKVPCSREKVRNEGGVDYHLSDSDSVSYSDKALSGASESGSDISYQTDFTDVTYLDSEICSEAGDSAYEEMLEFKTVDEV